MTPQDLVNLTPPRGMAALLMHQALAMDVEAGVPPMKAIQAATLNVARTFKKDLDYGSVEPGKVADLAIVEGDPLADIWMTQNVKMVVMDGKVMDIGFKGYKNPIASFYSYQSLPLDLEISPLFLIEGSGPTTLKVRGEGGMWPFHQVMLNGQPLPNPRGHEAFQVPRDYNGIEIDDTTWGQLSAIAERYQISLGR